VTDPHDHHNEAIALDAGYDAKFTYSGSGEMANHKRKRTKNRRCGCLLCKPWKVNGFRTERLGGERFSDHRRRKVAAEEAKRELR
jgi:hypothetical protein